jgi:hypothetical protein
MFLQADFRQSGFFLSAFEGEQIVPLEKLRPHYEKNLNRNILNTACNHHH